MSRYDLTDSEWRVIEPLLPNKPRGVPRVDDRRVLNGIFWVLRSGAYMALTLQELRGVGDRMRDGIEQCAKIKEAVAYAQATTSEN